MMMTFQVQRRTAQSIVVVESGDGNQGSEWTPIQNNNEVLIHSMYNTVGQVLSFFSLSQT